jgi:hypothetical protein
VHHGPFGRIYLSSPCSSFCQPCLDVFIRKQPRPLQETWV